ncbi:MAG: MFS transporter, partial [Microbacteriaceae bacterium]|nr:MFS transporter [Microbacteriaceae bacterium]
MHAAFSPSPAAITRWVAACLVLFFAMGFSFATWLSRLPSLRDEMQASTLQMSVYGLCLAVGSLAGLIFSGGLIERTGPRRTLLMSIIVKCAMLPLAALLLVNGQVAVGLIALFIYGVSFSLTDIAMNVSGANAEHVFARPRLTLMHACYSLGAVAALGLGAAAEALRVSLQLHFVIVMVVIAAVGLWVLRWIPRDEAELRVPVTTNTLPIALVSSSGRYSPWRDPRVLLIGLITLSAGLFEGSASDWLPLALVDGRGVSNEFGAIMLGLFYASVVASRLIATPLLMRFSRTAVLRVGLSLGSIGVLVVSLVPGPAAMIIGTLAWGFGAGAAWPITISAAADRAKTAIRDVAAVSAIGYTSMLIGPMAFGFLGEVTGLLQAFLLLPLFGI